MINDFIEEMKGKPKDFMSYNTDHDVYCFTKTEQWIHSYTTKTGIEKTKNKLMYLHGYYDGIRAEGEKKEFIKTLKNAEEAFRANADDCTASQKELVHKYFEIDKKGMIRSHRQEAIDKHMNGFGYFVLLSNHLKDAKHTLTIYRNKDVVEKTFCNLKNRLDMNRTKVNSEESLEGKLFVQFIALIYISYIHQIMTGNNLYKNYTTASLLDEVDVIEVYQSESQKKHYSEVTKKQRDILDCFKAQLA